MQADSTQQLSFAELSGEQGKAVEVAFDGGDLTSDGGLLLLGQLERRIGLSARLCAAVGDRRQPGKVRHSLSELFRARIGAIAVGYPDCNDLNPLRIDPALRLFSGQRLWAKKSASGANGSGGNRSEANRVLAGQSTLCRFENGMTRRQVYRLALELARATIEQLPIRTEQVVIEFDSTDDPCHGQQQFEGFNAYYREHCFMPLLCHLAVKDQKGGVRRWQLPVLLRPGRVHGTVGVRAVLKRVVALLRERFPAIQIIVRADSGFGSNEVLCACERLEVDYVIGLPQNTALHRESRHQQMQTCLRYTRERDHWRLMARSPAKWRPPCDALECVEYGSIYHRADSWPKVRRVVVKSAITHNLAGEAALNPRFVVTSLVPIHLNAAGRLWKADEVYRFYCQRGDQENRIKEWKLDLEGGRTSCHRFLANQFRLLLHGAALLLLNLLQSHLDPQQAFGRTSVGTFRASLLKVAARITVTCRRIRIQLPSAFPYQETWRLLHLAMAA